MVHVRPGDFATQDESGPSFGQILLLNQSIKAVAVARRFLAPRGIDIVCIPALADEQIGGETRSSIEPNVEPRR
jgi:stage V sporulation protein SpoVS